MPDFELHCNLRRNIVKKKGSACFVCSCMRLLFTRPTNVYAANKIDCAQVMTESRPAKLPRSPRT